MAIKEGFNALATEAKSTLSMKVDKTYIPPGRKSLVLVLFENPSQSEYIFTALFWVALALLSQTQFWPEPLIRFLVDVLGTGESPILNTIFSLVCVNIGLTLSVLGMGIYAEFPWDCLWRWLVLTPFFGFMTAGRMIKIGYKRKFELDAMDDIG